MARVKETKRLVKKKVVVRKLANVTNSTLQDARIKRNRVQTKPYQAPNASVPQSATRVGHVKKPVVKKANKLVKKTTGVADKISKAKKVTKKEAAREKAKQVARKGNERLKKRDGIKINKENAFFGAGSAPEFVSVATYHRWLIRALVRKNVNEMRNIFKSKKINAQCFERHFSYVDGRSADSLVCRSGDVKLIEEYYKLKDAVVKEKKNVQLEPDLLQRKTTGQRNFYMLGRATRVLQMSRGGKEGNNAFLDYEEGGSGEESTTVMEALVQSNTAYKDIFSLCQIKETSLQMGWLDTNLVHACRRGHTELAHAIAKAEGQYCTNELQRETLKVGGKLPAKILSVSVLKKCFGNKNITPLHTAAINPDGAKMLEQMRAVEPNINVPDQDAWFTIHYAAVCRNAEPLRYLLKNGAVPTMHNKKQESPLHVAAIAGRAETTKVLMETIDKLEKGDGGEAPKAEKSLLNARSRSGNTALLLAVRNGHIAVVKTLLENEKVLPDIPSSATTNKITPLMLACARGDLEIAKLLVSKDALVEARDKKKRTPLIHAVMNGQEHTAAYLLSLGADILKADSSGNTAAHYTAAYGWLQCLQLLADVDPACLSVENDWKIAPLTVAFLKGHYGIVTWLLDGKYKDQVNINGKDMEGYTLLSCLLSFTDPEVHQQLPEQIDYLLKRGADCTLTDSMDNTVLHDFAGMDVHLNKDNTPGMTEKAYRECFEMLCDKASEAVMAKNQDGMTPMHVALRQGNLLVFNWFLERIKDLKAFFSERWLADNSFIQALLELPMQIWQGNRWENQPRPPLSLYDVLPLIKGTLMKQCKAEVEAWLRENNKDGVNHVLALMQSYNKLNSRGRVDEDEKPFVAYVGEMFAWICDVFPEVLTLQTPATDCRMGGSLIHSALLVPLEKGCNSFLRTLLDKAVQHKLIGEALRQEIDKLPLAIHALRTSTGAVKTVLEYAAKNKCTDGVHNALLKTVKETKDEKEVERVVNRTLLMLIIAQNEFDLANDLILSADEWKAKDAEGNSAWHLAAKSNHHRTMMLMKNLEAKKVSRETNDKGATPLHMAVQACDGSANSVMEPIEWLVQRSSVADQDVFGRTAMHYAFGSFDQLAEKQWGAVQKDPIAVVSILAMNITEQQLNVTDVDGNTALHLAAAAGANICAVTLLRKGAKVDIVNKEGNTPLALAVLHSRQGVALTLIQANSCVTDKVVPPKPEKNKEEKWMWKALIGEEEPILDSTIPAQIVKRGIDWAAMVYVLLDTLGKNVKSLTQITVCALKEKQYNLANQLLKSLEAILDGESLNAEEDHLVLVFAKSLPRATTMEAESVERTVLDRLLGLGCPLMHGDSCPAFEVALKHSAWWLAKYLKEKMGQKWNKLASEKEDEGPLHALLTGGHLKDVASIWMDELIKLKHLKVTTCSLSLPTPANMKGYIEGKYTALGWAALSGNVHLIEFLRRKGFDVNAADEHGRTPMMLAVVSNSGETVEALCSDLSASAPQQKTSSQRRVVNNFSRHLAFVNGRKRKADSDEDEDSDEDDEEEEKEESEQSGGESDEEEEENNNKKPSLTKRFKIANKQLSLEAKDFNGRNLFHYLCEPIAWENVDLFSMMSREQKNTTKKLLGEKDSQGMTPQALAAKLKLRRMTTAMGQITGQNTKVAATELPDVKGLETDCDVSGDSKVFMDKFAAENDKKATEKTSEDRPCQLSGYSSSGIVEKCKDTDQYFRVLMNKSDLSYGRFGFHNFYRMELIKRRDTDLWNLFTNWGRIGGGDGEFQSTPFGTLDAAVKEFKSVFKSKAGQDWCPLDKFVDQPKKYRLVKVNKSPSSLADVELPPYGKGEEEEPVRAFVKDISDPKKLKEYQKQIYQRLNVACPFGRVTGEAIDSAREILKDCYLVAKQIQVALGEKGNSQEKLLRLINQANDLSSEFYSVIPIGNAEFSSLTRLDSDQVIQNAEISLNRMAEIEVATRILTAAASHPDIDRIQYVSSAIECGIRAMGPGEEMSQNILQWIHNTSDDPNNYCVKGILEVAPMRSVDAFSKFATEDYQKLLFHGTRAANLVSLLRDGFLVDPTHASIQGRRFGNGIYLADYFDKSNCYCEASGRGWKYMLICQVAFGKLAVRQMNKWEDEDVSKYDALLMEGEMKPKNSITVNGVIMPVGSAPKKNPNKNRWYYATNYSEYIIANPQRVLPRFIVMYK